MGISIWLGNLTFSGFPKTCKPVIKSYILSLFILFWQFYCDLVMCFRMFVFAGVGDGMAEPASGIHLNEPRILSFTRSVHHDVGIKGNWTWSGQHQDLSAQPGGSCRLRETEGHACRGFTAQGAYVEHLPLRILISSGCQSVLFSNKIRV